MEDRREKLLLEEYRLNVELMIHDDRLRQQRITNFLTANSLLALYSRWIAQKGSQGKG